MSSLGVTVAVRLGRSVPIRGSGGQFGPARGLAVRGRWRHTSQTRAEQPSEYAKFLAEARNHANSLIEESMRRWERQDGSAEDA